MITLTDSVVVHFITDRGEERWSHLTLSARRADGDGLELSRYVRENAPATRTIVYSGRETADCAIEDLRSYAPWFDASLASLEVWDRP